MQAIRELYKIGRGPSSSHTLAPERACRLFVQEFGEHPYYEVELYGSLSLTGKGHNTDLIIQETLPGKVEIKWKLEWKEDFPNGFYLKAFNEKKELEHIWTVFSLGGGSIQVLEKDFDFNDEVYVENNFNEIKVVLEKKQWDLLDYVLSYEPDILSYLEEVILAEMNSVSNGLKREGILPGNLKLARCAKDLFELAKGDERLQIMSYAYAANEENASMRTVVTAPTLGACGIIAALSYYLVVDKGYTVSEVAKALAVGGVFGNVIKQNATISGAMGGCQAEVGSAVSMACAMLAWIRKENLEVIESAAEIGMEHHLGLTCDPVQGYVMIPCIERNSQGILRVLDSVHLASTLRKIKKGRINFDTIVETMKETGRVMDIQLRETSKGGLAKFYKDSQC
ncbi:L-serine ammonia-lyase, iron-sulfur-dependent, subunit alpha [Bulleidia sp. zg-1006]|uniref:L-serine ammonia-lyase, iron-sulfur-dependent, subunit alpha n=1 Tax=Bulleidia sp. zg-1006 TaxID=2806552 RepID=UPI001EEDCE17|nr:L-serine ammonia-lyase, iron-sulfur-dependent, subunit alpha [Bulleidia sp. zg-1006]